MFEARQASKDRAKALERNPISLHRNLPRRSSSGIHQAWAQFWYEDLLDISLEGITVDGAVEHEGGDEASHGQRANECCGLPMAVGHSDSEPLSPSASAMAARHVGGSPGLIDEAGGSPTPEHGFNFHHITRFKTLLYFSNML